MPAPQRQQRSLEFTCPPAFLPSLFPTSKKSLPCLRGVGTIRNWKALSKGNFSIYQILSSIQWHLTLFNYGLSKAFSTVEWSGVEKQIIQWTDAAEQRTKELLAFSLRCPKRRWSTLKEGQNDQDYSSGWKMWNTGEERRREYVSFSMEEQQCCSLFRRSSVSGESSSGGEWWGTNRIGLGGSPHFIWLF